MKRSALLLLFVATAPTILQGWFLDPATIRIANKTTIPLYAAFYYLSKKGYTRADYPVLIPTGNALLIEPPSPQFLSARRIALATSEEELAPTLLLSPDATAPIGLLCTTDFTAQLHPVTGTLRLLRTADWLAQERQQPTEPAFIAYEQLHEERTFVEARRMSVHAHQEAWCAQPLTQPLSIAVCASGGGFRAMFATAGLMLGLEDLGILPLIQECVCLS